MKAHLTVSQKRKRQAEAKEAAANKNIKSNPIAVLETTPKEVTATQQVQIRAGRKWTLSVALPGSLLQE
jgi:ribosomal protein L13E